MEFALGKRSTNCKGDETHSSAMSIVSIKIINCKRYRTIITFQFLIEFSFIHHSRTIYVNVQWIYLPEDLLLRTTRTRRNVQIMNILKKILQQIKELMRKKEAKIMLIVRYVFLFLHFRWKQNNTQIIDDLCIYISLSSFPIEKINKKIVLEKILSSIWKRIHFLG